MAPLVVVEGDTSSAPGRKLHGPERPPPQSRWLVDEAMYMHLIGFFAAGKWHFMMLTGPTRTRIDSDIRNRK